MKRVKREVNEIETEVKGWNNGGAYVSVPTSWIGKTVIIRKAENPFTE